MVVFKDKLYLIDNGGIFASDDLKHFERVFILPVGNEQCYAVYVTPGAMYIGSGWNFKREDGGIGNIFMTMDGRNFIHITSTPETPMPYFINRASDQPGLLLFGGYNSKGLYLLDVNKKTYRKVFKADNGSFYVAEEFEGDIFIGSYGVPPEIIRVKLPLK